MALTDHASRHGGTPSLEDIHGSVPIPRAGWRRLLAFSGPAFLVSVGYMDPGNWGSDLQAGSQFGYRLMWVLLLSNLMAMLLQSLATRLGVVTGRDLAQACRENYPRPAVFALWVLCEIAIAATDLAEVIGTVIALRLLFGLPYLVGLLVALCDTFLLLALQRRGVRLLELVTIGLILVIAGSFAIEIFHYANPSWGDAARGLVPTLDPRAPGACLYVAISMLGATVMPHNLYLHSALVQTRAFPQTEAGKGQACRYNLIDSMVALNGAFLVNAAILILAAATFTEQVETLQEAHRLLGSLWGATLASILFGVALLASGQSSTLTGTLAGQVVMEGFVRLRLRPWVRRLLTRSLAIVPALIVIAVAEHASGGQIAEDGSSLIDQRLLQLLVLSQAILSFQLPFAIVPLVQFTSDRRRMGRFASGVWLKALAWSCALVVVGLNVCLIIMQMRDWGGALEAAGWDALWIYGPVSTVSMALAVFLTWLALRPLWSGQEARQAEGPTATVPVPPLPVVFYRRIGVALELEGGDVALLVQAAALARVHRAELVVLHVVEGTGAALYGPATDDQESRADRARMATLVEHLRVDGLEAKGVLGFGHPAGELTRLALELQLDLLVVGTHGHGFFADLALGHTVAPMLHRMKIPVLVVPTRA